MGQLVKKVRHDYADVCNFCRAFNFLNIRSIFVSIAREKKRFIAVSTMKVFFFFFVRYDIVIIILGLNGK